MDWIRYTMASMIEKVVDIIKKSPNDRTDAEINLITPWLHKKTNVFQGVEPKVLAEIVKNCEYVQAERDEVLIRQGDIGDRLFIILLGTVSVYVDSSKTGEEDRANRWQPPEDKDDTSARKRLSGLDECIGTRKISKAGSTFKLKSTSDRSKFGKFIVKIEEGKCFGEIALITEDSVRNATIISDSATDLVVIKKNLYDSTLKAHQQQEFKERQEFVRKHPLFRNWPKRFQRLLEMSLVKENYTFGAQLIKQGDPYNGLIFLTKGRARVLVEPARHKLQYPDHFPFATKNDIYAIEFNRPQKKRQDHIEEILRWEHIEIRRTEGYVAAERRQFNREIPLCIVEEGEILGDLECVFNLTSHTVSAVCMAPTEVFMLTSKNFERLVTKRNRKTLNTLTMEVETKLQNRLTTQQGSEVFFYRHLHFKLTEEIQPTPRKLPDFGIGKMSRSLPDKDVLFQHLMATFMEKKAEAIIPYVPGSVFLLEKMREKARLRKMVMQNKGSNDGPRRTKPRHIKRPPSAKPRSMKHLRLALKKQEESAEQTEREYLAKEYRTLETEVMKEFYLNSLAGLSETGDEKEGLKLICERLHKAGIHLTSKPLTTTDKSQPPVPVETAKEESSKQTPTVNQLTRQKTFVTELNLSEPDLLKAQKLEEEALSMARLKQGGSKSAEPTSTIITDNEQVQTVTEPLHTEQMDNLDDDSKGDGAENKTDDAATDDVGNKQDDPDTKQAQKDEGSVPANVTLVSIAPPGEKHEINLPPLNAASEVLVTNRPARMMSDNMSRSSPISANSAADSLLTSESYKRLEHLRSLISNKIELARGDPKYRDWETSNNSLNYLEHRVKKFKVNKEPTFVRLPPLQRFEVGDDKKDQPKPGGRVIIQRKRCDADDSGKYVSNHKHTRRHMVEQVPAYTKLKRNKMLSHFVLNDAREKWMDGENQTQSNGNRTLLPNRRPKKSISPGKSLHPGSLAASQ